MGYAHVVQMAQSSSLQNRIVACAAALKVESPASWVAANLWHIVSWDPEWASVWEYYSVSPQFTANVNPDTGARTDVIADSNIEEVITALMPQPVE